MPTSSVACGVDFF